MAKETITKLVDDLDGGVAHETVRFGLDGQLYEIDLSSKNAKKLRSELATFVEHGSRVNGGTTYGSARRAPKRPVQRRTERRTMTGAADQNRAIREWAQAKGYHVAPRGRLKQEIVEAFQHKAGR
jgi:nucleoid-associated protein Lsr2